MLAGYRANGYVLINSEQSLDQLISLCQGQTNIFVGQSGAGKSTLINRLDPANVRAHAVVSLGAGRGKHTTRETELFTFLNGYLIDSPGFSLLDLDLTPTELSLA
ncbi:unnamed protein product [Didymodactylos carnosus]|uniref:EngC GTPase domain-containing protein n=1 Tax=Didymodactylos carnosus TaxID=1234261 RepID=A0A8S2H255_9BILA|nr:unnamed protein product [Didymodactylos carnosus]CAF3588627.1 unnamed protein product [Didymodactylos carnosus]